MEVSNGSKNNKINHAVLWEYEIDGSVSSAAISSDGGYIVVGDYDDNIYFLNKEGELLWRYKTDGKVESVAITQDGKHTVVGSEDGCIYFFNKEGRLLWKYETDDSVGSLAITPSGDYIVAGCNYDVYIFDREGELLWKYETDDHIRSVAITPSGDYIAAGSQDKNIYFFNEEEEELLWKYETDGVVESVAITPDGEYVVAGGWDKNIYFLDRRGWLLWKYEADSSVGFVAITSDNKYIIAGSYDNTYIFNKEGDLLRKYETGRVLSITPDGKCIITRGKNKIYLLISVMEIAKIIEEIEPKVKLFYNLDKLLESAKKELEKENYEDAIHYINRGKELIEKSKPEIKIKFINTSSLHNKWDKVKMEIINEGEAIARNITLEFPEDTTTKNLSEIEIKPESKKKVEFNLKSNAFGEIPVEVEIGCKDHLNRECKFRQVIKIEVEKEDTIHRKETPEKGTTPAEFTPKPTTPKTFPPELSEKYLEIEFIGRGGFARVFKAKRKDGKEVAIKIPISLDEYTGKSFLKGIVNWTKLNHNNIVKIYDYNILPIPYFEMELCDKSLADLKKPLDPEKAAWIIFNIAEGLKYIHSQRILHRDLKPHNILLKDGIPKISDWGLSKVMAEYSSVITTKAFTLFYVSPEQIEGKSIDEGMDIWQMGVIFYELVTGELPFKGDNFVQILIAIAKKDPIPPSEINPEAKEVEKIIMKCLEKDKTKRYQSVKELQRDLAEYLRTKYKESLKLSVSRKDFKRSAYYCCELLLINMKTDNIIEAYKYTSDLLNYTEGEVKQEVQELHEHLKFRVENGIKDIPEELIKVADDIAHRIRVEF